ncbi:CPA2 family monovalent cation:H+ antiporter-2 [Dysgonomonas sp. PFB1-18]|uniref:cation:proton antiporter n=1 Tax=unclassified Dysgonomonas TaxID=2630389 RepID=UPI00247427CA|nr:MULTISPECIES: cation:proton antiporter [unclassified Dysgonomonas]MDH6308692.1 CPA2 family monovalent cation:H+ antiporter-2 [Dysgonomonas sp. PF1-14]MDH6338611.1 CPA2 family monovalent cation:H+ antiporter-2 [Dysgonomonas sp. PF1-16]MDH6379941.1 CPA2 family monovalent cation:H+ antiporter-2 [Dysgonomonas sp. PFB1-18]MDH6397439.1 CPA2 family monovalent cation:H+ antiporter-2 [Dysgonomonas sp. PF1-23]
MAHLPDFISDLAIILITAGIVTIIFKRLKQPVVLGYIVAGFLASLHFKNFIESLVVKITGVAPDQVANVFKALPEISDMANVTIWSELGVIFLLFALGLEFSFKKLMDVGGKASIATLINLGSMIIIGYLAGQLFISQLIEGWTTMDSIYLGCMLSMSSTTIIIKAFNDMGLQKKKFAGIVFGMLIVEDLAAIVMMVLLTTFAVSQHFETGELANSIVSLLFFMLIWFVVGIYMIPTMLKKLKKYLNDETLLIVAIGLCLGMVYFATAVGFSAALGAFIMGSILAETVESKHIEHLIEPLKNLFGAVFFVSVGMMIDPAVIGEYSILILILTLVILIGRPFFAAIGVLASGEGLKVAVQSGFSLAQIGEFSFIIATLGMSLGVITETLYPIIVAVSVITTFTTPYCIKYSDNVYGWIEKRIPNKWEKLIHGYSASGYDTVNKQTDWKKLLQSILTLVAIYFTISIAILLVFQNFITPYIVEWMPGIWGNILAAIITLVLMAPFLRAIMMKKNRSEEFKNLWGDNRLNKGALISLIAFRIIICVVLVLMVLIPLFPRLTVLMVIISLVVVTLIIFSQGFKAQSRKIEARFLENLNLKQRMDEKKAAILPTVANDLRSKNIHIEEFEISQNSPSIGKSLRELNFRQKTGVNVVTIIRGSKKINIPDGNERLYPFDKLVVSGSDDEMQQLSQYLQDKRAQVSNMEEEAQHHISLSQYLVVPESPLIGKTIGGAGIREKTECMVIGIDRGDESIIQFTAGFMFEEGDVIWLAGEKEKLNSFEENISDLTPLIP